MRRHLILILVLTALTAATARADGLLYQLPEDGAWAQFEVRITNRAGSTRTAQITMRSVGRVQENEACRWIELKLPIEESTQVVKLLVPEKYLKEGQAPLDHVVRGWRKLGDEVPVTLTNPHTFWLLVLLPGPLDNVKKLDREVVESKLGRLECEGLTGRTHVKEEDGYEEDLAYTIRRHPKAPFGVVSCRFECKVLFGGKLKDVVNFQLKLTDFGKEAESELRGYE